MITEEDIRQQELLDKIARKGERMAMLTKFMVKNTKKILWATVSLVVGGALDRKSVV